jgi:hypothetical protein
LGPAGRERETPQGFAKVTVEPLPRYDDFLSRMLALTMQAASGQTLVQTATGSKHLSR